MLKVALGDKKYRYIRSLTDGQQTISKNIHPAPCFLGYTVTNVTLSYIYSLEFNIIHVIGRKFC